MAYVKKSKEEVSRSRRESARKRWSDPEYRAKNTGNPCSEETKNKIGDKNRGSKHTEETKEVMREKKLEQWQTPEYRKTHGKAMEKARKNPEFGNKLRASHKENWKNPEYAKKMFKAWEMKPTKPEIRMQELLNELFPGQYKYVGDGEFIIAGKNPDFINCNGQKKIIEVYGDYWHKDDNPQDRIDIFSPYGYQTLVIWESELEDHLDFVKNDLEYFHNLVH